MRKLLHLITVILIVFNITQFYELFFKDRITGIDPKLKPYYIEFVSYLHTDYKINIGFADLSTKPGGNTVGLCNYITNTVLIDKKFWDSSDGLTRKAVIYHELFHCIMGKKHDERRLDNGCPYTIMYPSLPTVGCLKKHLDGYVEDQFRYRTPKIP